MKNLPHNTTWCTLPGLFQTAVVGLFLQKEVLGFGEICRRGDALVGRCVSEEQYRITLHRLVERGALRKVGGGWTLGALEGFDRALNICRSLSQLS